LTAEQDSTNITVALRGRDYQEKQQGVGVKERNRVMEEE